ncbi:DUF2064 domain-containing protein [Oceanicella sp. SM1341]|uniref:DUF2064 domain-containing protein n=1 Tax=Oceanicella sp. SM1341 TaxID=1548889 RepID=UPI000E50CDD2|nr:DUF2064 domain-containing protein [Oceanicella sp. SM1341]
MADGRCRTVLLLGTRPGLAPAPSTGALERPRLSFPLARLRERALHRRLAHDRRWSVLDASRCPAPRSCAAPEGEALARLLRATPPGPVLLVDSRVPGIGRAQIAEAFAALTRADAVFGPTPEGGYWLMGLARAGRPVPGALFRDVRWHSRHVLGDTLAGLQGQRVAFVTPLDEPAPPGPPAAEEPPRQPALRLVVT